MNGIKALYNRRAHLYVSLMDGMRSRSTARAIGSVLPQSLPAGSKIIDLGAGSGLATALLARKYPEAHLTALDFSDQLLSTLKKRLPDVQVIKADMNRRPQLASAPFQLAVSAGAVSEYCDLNTVLPWLYSNLAPGSLFINIGVGDNFLGRLTGRLWRFRPRSKTAFAFACRSAGFEKVAIQLAPTNIFFKHHEEYIVTARRPAKI